jgi:hypothetical protein
MKLFSRTLKAFFLAQLSLSLLALGRLNGGESICYLEEEAKADPLIVSIDLSVVGFAFTISDARIRHLLSGLLEEHALQRICAVNPAVCVENVLGYVLGVDTVDGIAHILSCGDN